MVLRLIVGGDSLGGCFVEAIYLFFFFQAEDGIRDTSVTGVQTCALPIYRDFIVASVILSPFEHV